MDDSIAPPPPRLPRLSGSMHQLQQPSPKRPQTPSLKPKLLPAASPPFMLREDQHHVDHGEHGLDALLANAGYSVRSSDVAHVAERLVQLESVLCAAEEAGLSHLSSDSTVHYNPSDLAGWIESMIGELVATTRGDSAASADMGPSTSGSGGEYCTSNHGSNNFNPSVDTVVSPNIITSTDISQGQISLEDVSYNDVMEELDDLISQYKEDINGHSPNSLSQLPSSSSTHHLSPPSNQLGSPLCPTLSTPEFVQFPAPLHSHPIHPTKPFHQLHSSGSVEHERSFSNGDLGNAFGSMGSFQHIQQAYDQNSRHLKTQSQPMRIKHAVNHKEVYALEQEGCATDQDNGVRVVHLLIACAGAVQKAELKQAHDMVKEIQALSYPRASGAMAKVAAHFVEALARRIYGVSQIHQQQPQVEAYTDLLYFHYYETCPYLKFAHFTANQAILEAFEGHKMVHVIDFSLMQGLQWPALIHALALRPGGPPQRLRLTGIGPPQPDDKDVLQEVGMKLAQLADSVNVEFDFRGVVATKLNDVQPWMLQVQPGEAVAVNSIFQLHRLLHCDCNTLHAPPIEEVLQSVRSINPKIITVVEQEANHNNPFFLERFMEALQYYCTMFDSIEASNGGADPQSVGVALAEMHLGREILNVVACEGGARFERHETLAQWRLRMTNAGFQPLHLGSNAFKQTSALLTLFSGDGYTVQENNGCLTLGWHSHPLLSASAWYC